LAVKTPEHVRQGPVLEAGDDGLDDRVPTVGQLGGQHRSRSGGERDERDPGDLGGGDPPLLLVVPDRVGYLVATQSFPSMVVIGSSTALDRSIVRSRRGRRP